MKDRIPQSKFSIFNDMRIFGTLKNQRIQQNRKEKRQTEMLKLDSSVFEVLGQD